MSLSELPVVPERVVRTAWQPFKQKTWISSARQFLEKSLRLRIDRIRNALRIRSPAIDVVVDASLPGACYGDAGSIRFCLGLNGLLLGEGGTKVKVLSKTANDVE